MEFRNKVAVITGASSGIGYALSKELTSAGMKVYSLSRNAPDQGVEGVVYLQADLTVEDQVVHAVSQISEPVDMLVNNAGMMKRGNYWEISAGEFDQIWHIDVKGMWLMFKYLRNKLSQGAITLQMNSKNARSIKADTFIYTLSKLADLEIDKLVKKDRSDLDMRVAYFGPVDTALEWTDYSQKQKNEKIKLALTAPEAGKLAAEFLRSDKQTLLYIEDLNSYEMN